MEKLFTLDEANALLPILEALLQRAMDAKDRIVEIDEKQQALLQKIFLLGGMLVDVPRVLALKVERETMLQQIRDSVAEISASGVQVKDLDLGLLDFPCHAGDETVLLCWKRGEPHKIAHFHGLEDGFAGRKPIEELPKPKKSGSDRPN